MAIDLPFSRITDRPSLKEFLRVFFTEYLGYERPELDPDDPSPDKLDSWRLIPPVPSARPIAVAFQAGLSGMARPAVSRLYVERVTSHMQAAVSVEPSLYAFTDGLRLVFFSADPARNRDDRFDLNQNTWEFHNVREKAELLRAGDLQFDMRLGRKIPRFDFLFEANALSADGRFKRYIAQVREDLIRAVVDDPKALATVVQYLLEPPGDRDDEEKRLIGADGRLRIGLRELSVRFGSSLGTAVAAAVDTLLLRYVMYRFLEAYHPEATNGLLTTAELLQRGGAWHKKVATGDSGGQLTYLGDGRVQTATFSEQELESAQTIGGSLSVDVSRAKKKAKGKDERQLDLFGFDDEDAFAASFLAEEQERGRRLGGDFYLQDLGRAAQGIETALLTGATSRGRRVLEDFFGRTGAPEQALWEFRYEDLKPATIQDYYESSLGTAVQIAFDSRTGRLEATVAKSNRQRKELGAYYTDPRLCRFMVERTVKPLFEERLRALQKSVGAKDENGARQAVARLLGMSICDPTMGSAPFLRSAFDYLSESYLRLYREVKAAQDTLPALYDEIARAHPFLGPRGGRKDDEGVGRWEWHILRRMLYGVDIDLKGVCIACQTFALSALRYFHQGERFPSFFNLNLKLGNALISPIRPEDRAELAAQHGAAIAHLIRLRRDAATIENTEQAYDQLASLLQEIDGASRPFVQALVQERVAPILGRFTDELRTFSWELEFPEVFFEDDGSLKASPGFDIVIGNPPWDAIKFNDSEFLEGIGTPGGDLAALRGRDPNVDEAYTHYLAGIKRWKAWVASGNWYEHQQGGRDRNKWRLATEVAWKLTGPMGAMSLVVPSGIVGDDGAVALKRLLFSAEVLGPFVSFEKENDVFPGTQGFTIFSVRKGKSTRTVAHVEGLRTSKELEDLPTALPVPQELIQSMSPISLTLPSIAHQIDLDILAKLYEFPTLDQIIAGTWAFTPYTAEIHMGHDRKNGRIVERETTIPLLTGEAISDFDVRFIDPYRHWVDPSRFALPESAASERVVWRNVVGTSDPRRMVVSLCPQEFAVDHSLNYVLPQQPLEVRLFLLGVLNSFLLEWRARQISRNNNMVHFVLKQLPIPRLSAGDSSFDAIVQMSGSLLAASPQLRHFEQTLGLQAVHPTPEREAVKATIDAVVALMYGLTEHELQHILNRFDLVSASTKERIVSAYNELQEG